MVSYPIPVAYLPGPESIASLLVPKLVVRRSKARRIRNSWTPPNAISYRFTRSGRVTTLPRIGVDKIEIYTRLIHMLKLQFLIESFFCNPYNFVGSSIHTTSAINFFRGIKATRHKIVYKWILCYSSPAYFSPSL